MMNLNPLNRRKQKGQSMAEYAIIISLIALVCIGAITLFGKQIKAVFSTATDKIAEGVEESDD